jgi:hypothetical protein
MAFYGTRNRTDARELLAKFEVRPWGTAAGMIYIRTNCLTWL